MINLVVYSICKNESANFANWAKQVEGADQVVVVDTGSDDDTLSLLTAWVEEDPNRRAFTRYGNKPFAFHTARNQALRITRDFVDGCYSPRGDHLTGRETFCVWVDFDETFTDNWIDITRNTISHELSKPQSRLDALYFEFNLNGMFYNQLRVHTIDNFHWDYHAHEVLMNENDLDYSADLLEIQVTQPVKEIRPNYLDLLVESAKHYDDQRSHYYLGREYFYEEDYNHAWYHLNVAITKPVGWRCEKGKAASFLAEICEIQKDSVNEFKFLQLYSYHCNLEREPLIRLMEYCQFNKDWHGVIHYGLRSLQIEKPHEYLTLIPSHYKQDPHDYLAEAYDKIGMLDEAAHHTMICVSYEPNNERYLSNLQYYIGEGILNFKTVDGENANGESDSSQTSVNVESD